MGVEQWVEKIPLGESFSTQTMKGVSVLSSRGVYLGKVAQVRLHTRTFKCAGIVARLRGSGRLVYFGLEYLATFSPQGVILSIEPAYLLLGKRVITSDGKVLGRVKEVHRVNSTNEIKEIIVKAFFRAPRSIPFGDIRSLAQSIILKEQYHAP